MVLELFLVSVIYWIAILAVLVWLNRRVSRLTEWITDLERDRSSKKG